ncbi:DUF515 domain-containing protein [Thermococcus sp.]
MAEDIEKKIRRLRELGRVTAEAEAPTPAVPPKAPIPSKKPPRRPRSLSAIRERERRKRILIGAAILITVILIVSVGAYAYLQSSAKSKLEKTRLEKRKLLESYFSSYNFSEKDCAKKAEVYKNEALAKINSATSLEELNSINVKSYFSKAVQAYKQCVETKERLAYEAKLNQTKQEKIQDIETAFQPLLSMPLPDSLRAKVVATLKSLEERVKNAKKIEDVLAINPDTYLLNLWREYYFWKIDNIPTNEVILEKDGSKELLSKAEAKSILGTINDYHELLKYSIHEVQYVDIALVLSRDKVAGGFLEPGDKIVLFAKNGTKGTFKEIANIGYVQMILLPVDAGKISVSESQSQGGSTSTSSSTTYSETHSSSYNPGEISFSNETTVSDTYSNSQSTTQSSSATYSYNVNLAEILKAIAAGKIQASDEVKAQLESYGWKIITLEQSTDMLVLPPDTNFLVIIRVPSIFVPDILQYQNFLYLARVS